MQELLQQAITQIEKLSAEEQDAIATRILADLADEEVWTARFNATTDKQWDHLTEMVRAEITAGKTDSLDDVFPSGSSRP